jgi:hypothetical protein
VDGGFVEQYESQVKDWDVIITNSSFFEDHYQDEEDEEGDVLSKAPAPKGEKKEEELKNSHSNNNNDNNNNNNNHDDEMVAGHNPVKSTLRKLMCISKVLKIGGKWMHRGSIKCAQCSSSSSSSSSLTCSFFRTHFLLRTTLLQNSFRRSLVELGGSPTLPSAPRLAISGMLWQQ